MKEKNIQNSFIWQDKKEERHRGEWLIWSAHTKHTLLFNCNNTIQDKIKARNALANEGEVAQANRHVKHTLMMGKARRREGVQTRKARTNMGKAYRREGAQDAQLVFFFCFVILFNVGHNTKVAQ